MNWYLIVAGIMASFLFAVFTDVFQRVYFQRIARRKKTVKLQTYEQLKRSRDSLLFVFSFFFFWVGVFLWKSVDLITYLGFWTGPVFSLGLLVIETFAWLVCYLLDRRKSAKQDLAQNSSVA